MALTYSPTAEPKMMLPEFTLPTVNGEVWSSQTVFPKPAKVFVFMCNHCPYVKAIEGRLITLAAELKKWDVPLVGICSNDATEYPEDRPEELKKSWQLKNYQFPYLIDESQELARKLGAVCTPDFFVFDHNNQLAYRGRLDDSWRDAQKVTRQELKSAVECLVQNRPIELPISPSMGCSIKWRESL